MAGKTRVVETEHGKEVRRPYEDACRDYVLGWVLGFALATLLFLSLATHELATEPVSAAALKFTYVFAVGMAVLWIIRWSYPVAFYELIEE